MDVANVKLQEPAELNKMLNDYYREAYDANSTSYADYKLQTNTNETDRLKKAWRYIYANSCKGAASPF